jgi:hypothetical protein
MSTITLDDIVNLHHNQLNTISRKLIYLMIKGDGQGHWNTVSCNDFARATALPRRSIDNVLRHLINASLIERRKSGPSHSSPFQYRTITL